MSWSWTQDSEARTSNPSIPSLKLYKSSHCPPNCRLPSSSAASRCKHCILISAYRQTVWTQIRLLLAVQSDLGPHCLQQGQQMTRSRQQLVAISSRRVIRYCLYPIACCMFFFLFFCCRLTIFSKTMFFH